MGDWIDFAAQPTFYAATALLLTNGHVLVQDAGQDGDGTAHWYILKPDQKGSYESGTWTPAVGSNGAVPDAHAKRLFFASAVLRDGTVFVSGGEYSGTPDETEITTSELYDPISNSWKLLEAPPDWTEVGDAPCALLGDGRLLIGAIGAPSKDGSDSGDARTALFDPTKIGRNEWTAGPTTLYGTSSEETWTLLGDGSVLSVSCFSPKAAKVYIPAPTPGIGKWVAADSTPDVLFDTDNEIGPGILLPDSRVFAVGATGKTCIFSPATASGTWHSGPPLPSKNGKQLVAKDAPACLLPSGNILMVLGPIGPCADATEKGYCSPIFVFEFNPATAQYTDVSPTWAAGNSTAPYMTRLLLLPNGDVLLTCQSQYAAIYRASGVAKEAWQPKITSAPKTLTRGKQYQIKGLRFNGLSQAVSYGDDASMATNYPLFRITYGNGTTAYARTHDHSTMSVATGSTVVWTNVTVPEQIPVGAAQASIVANGIASSAIEVTIN